MASRSAGRAPEMQESKPRLPDPSLLTGRCRTPRGNAVKGKSKALSTKRMASASPLENVDTNRISPTLSRPLPSATTSIPSRTSSLPTTPLDEIPEKLWPRVLRMASTPETSNPELSIDEITSTRLSLDDQVILTNLPKESDRREAQSRRFLMRVAFGSMWGEHNERLKKMTKRLKKIPNGLFARKDRGSLEAMAPPSVHPTPTPEPSLPQLELTTELCVPTTRTSSNSEDSAGVDPVPLMNYECRPKDSESYVEEMAKISSLIRKDLHEATNRDRALPPLPPGNPQRLPRHFTSAPTYAYAASTSTVNSIHVAEDRLLHGPRSLKALSRQGVTSAPSIGSVEEMRSHAFGSRRPGRPSLSGGSVRHSSAPSISRTSQPASRPATHSGSISSTSATIVPRRPVLFMDAPNSSCSELVWNGQGLKKRPSTSSTTRPVSKGASVRNSHDECLSLSFNSQPEVGVGFGDVLGYNKIPLYVPRRVEPTQLSQSLQQTESSDDKERLFLHPELKTSNPTVSDISFGSLQGQTSIRSHLEREAMIREQESELELRPTVGNREKLSRALYTAWSESTSRRWQKGYKQQEA